MVVNNDNFDKNNLTNIIANSIESIIPNSIISAENIAKPSSKESDPKVSQKGNKQFYIGIQTGLSYSQIKSQGFTKPGYNIGLIAGFAFSKKWMVETGLLLTNKSYYTSGEYFNSPKSDPFMPVGMVVKSLDANCNMFEIPLTIKYNFPSKKEHNIFFANVGITNYIITKEHNNYLASLNGGIPQHLEATYNENNNKIIGAINLGFGYENKLYKKIKIRFEPYLQIPINGIGIGELPVSTVGLHIGFFNNR